MKATLCVVLIGLFMGLYMLAGCSDDDSSCLNCPLIGTTPDATLENIWPNADSTSWDYSSEMRHWGDFNDLVMYENREDVPPTPTPSWDEIRGLLDSDPIVAGDTVRTISGSYHLMFDGETKFGDIITQNLSVRHVLEDTITTPDGVGPASLKHAGLVRTSAAEVFVGYPILIHGGAWQKASDRIISYGDLTLAPSWQFLTDELSPGDEFVFQLGMGLVDDIYLYCRVDRILNAQTEAGAFRKSIDCLYIIDYGVSGIMGPFGQVEGYFRNIDAGRVIYAPTAGPVYCYERHLVQPGVVRSRGLIDITVDLTDSNLLSD